MNDLPSPARRRLLAACGALPWLLNATPVIAAPEPRAVPISWAGAQMLLELCVTPLAIADKSEYLSSHCRPPLPETVADLGFGDQPSLDALQRLKPNLILVDAAQQAVGEQLERFAPLFSVNIYRPGDAQPYLRAQQETLRLAQRLNILPRAQQRIAWLEDYLGNIRQKLAALALPPLLVADLHPDGRHLWIYGGSSMLQDVLNRLGLHNAWPGPFSDSGYSPLLGIEQLAGLDDVLFLYIARPGVSTIATLNRSPIWQQLPFVRQRQVRPLRGFFAMGALSCAQQFAEALIAAVHFSETSRDV